MVWKQASFLGAALLSAEASAGLIPRAGQWAVGIDPVQAVINQDDSGIFSFQCQHWGRTVVSASNIGLTTSQGDIGPSFSDCTTSQSEDRVEYTIPTGRETSRSTTYKTQVFNCKADGKDTELAIRVGLDGCAFRMKVSDGSYQVTGETSKWTFAQNGASFLMDDPENTSYEGEWIESDASTGLSGSRRVMMPYLVDAGAAAGDVFVLLAESMIDRRWQGSQLTHSSGSLDYTFELAEGGTVQVDGPVYGPWRIAVVGDLPTLYKSHFDQDNQWSSNITDQSWIKPGTVAWSWLPEPGSGADFERQKDYVDLAESMGWPYSLVDENWSPDWIPDLVQYAAAKGVGIIIWYNSNRWNSVEDVATNIADMKNWGVKGAKIDFFLSDKQATHNQMDYVLSQTAEAQLMVNFHGCPPQRGRQREWPHLMTTEGIRGDELYASSFRHTVIPLTRGLIGSMDFTPSLYTAAGVFYTDEKQADQSAQCSVGCGLAKSIVFESGWQHPGEKPEVLAESKYALAARMYKQLPTAWQGSDLLGGSYPGRATVVGRRSDALDRYYFAGVFNGGEQIFELRPSNLPAGRDFILDIVHDSPGNDGDRTAIERTVQQGVNSGSVISIPVKSNGGFSAIACESAGSDGGCLSD